MAKKERSIWWSWLDRMKGDKVIWMIVILLTLFSTIALFSSTSMDTAVNEGSKDRMDVFVEQLYMVAFGFGILLVCYFMPTIRLFRVLSQFGFLISMSLLIPLFMHINADVPKEQYVFIRAQFINSAWRTLFIAGKIQLHVFEVVKVMMILYLSWAVHAWKNYDVKNVNGERMDMGFDLARKIASHDRFKWVDKPFWLGIFYIFIPVCLVCIGLISGSVSTVLFVGLILFTTLFIGGFPWKHLAIYVGIIVTLFAAGWGLYGIAGSGYSDEDKERLADARSSELKAGEKFYLTLGKVYGRFSTASTRLERLGENLSVQEQLELCDGDPDEMRRIADKYVQTEGAKIAIKEGGLLGKGPGKSTQKYRVPLIFGDYMYSFIIEEYGLWGAVLILILFVSLLARGSRIAMNCSNVYARTAVGGLTILISGQGIMHMMINVGLMPITGQTLPIISEGKSSLMMFYLAFGVLLSISKMVKQKMDKEAAEAPDILPEAVPSTGDEIADSMNDLNNLDTE